MPILAYQVFFSMYLTENSCQAKLWSSVCLNTIGIQRMKCLSIDQ